MNLLTLRKFAHYLKQTPPLKLRSIYRIADNLFKIDINGDLFFVDLSKGKSTIFITQETLLCSKVYQAPFDKSLQKYCFNSWIVDAKVDGNNRILQLVLETKNSYKTSQVVLQAEFTGKNTNLILLDSKNIVLDALRHLTKEQSFREVRITKPLLPLPQPTNTPMLKEEGELFATLENNFKILKAKDLQAKIAKSSAHLSQKIAQLQYHLESLEDRSTLENNAKKEAYLGQLILQNLYLYPDFKEREICLENEKILLPLQAHSLSHTAQIFFENSKKLAKKAKNIHLQTRNLEEKIFFYQKLLQMIQNVTNLNDLQILDSNLQRNLT